MKRKFSELPGWPEPDKDGQVWMPGYSGKDIFSCVICRWKGTYKEQSLVKSEDWTEENEEHVYVCPECGNSKFLREHIKENL